MFNTRETNNPKKRKKSLFNNTKPNKNRKLNNQIVNSNGQNITNNFSNNSNNSDNRINDYYFQPQLLNQYNNSIPTITNNQDMSSQFSLEIPKDPVIDNNYTNFNNQNNMNSNGYSYVTNQSYLLNDQYHFIPSQISSQHPSFQPLPIQEERPRKGTTRKYLEIKKNIDAFKNENKPYEKVLSFYSFNKDIFSYRVKKFLDLNKIKFSRNYKYDDENDCFDMLNELVSYDKYYLTLEALFF